MTASAVQLQHRRGNAAQVLTFTGAQGELAVDTTNNRLVVQDGVTQGGWAAAKLSEVARLRIELTGVNFNSANTDNAVAVPIPPGYSTYLVSACYICGASGTLTTATCGLFTAQSAGGTAIVTTGTAVTVSTASANTNNNTQSLTINNTSTQSYDFATLYFRVQTPEGTAATADVILFVIPLF